MNRQLNDSLNDLYDFQVIEFYKYKSDNFTIVKDSFDLQVIKETND